MYEAFEDAFMEVAAIQQQMATDIERAGEAVWNHPMVEEFAATYKLAAVQEVSWRVLDAMDTKAIWHTMVAAYCNCGRPLRLSVDATCFSCGMQYGTDNGIPARRMDA